MHSATGCDEVPAEQPEFRVQLREDVVYGRVGDRELLLDAVLPEGAGAIKKKQKP